MSSDAAQMLRDIASEIHSTRHYTGRAAFDPRVMAAMAAVPRPAFVPEVEQAVAYANGPLPIGHGQTISQPYIVALMTDLLGCGPRDRVLEIGTGSGYQTAVLATLVAQVYSLEILPALARQAGERLARLGYANVSTRCADGYFGWPEEAPYDGILITAAAPVVPPPLIEQLAPGARLIAPVGPAYGHQELVRLEKDAHGQVRAEALLAVAFVPLTRHPAP